MTERLYTYRGRLVRETDKAFLARLEQSDDDVWLPKAECEHDGGSEFVVPDWLAAAKDLPTPKGPW